MNAEPDIYMTVPLFCHSAGYTPVLCQTAKDIVKKFFDRPVAASF